MIYKSFKDKKLSMLGFGTMRLPLIDGTSKIDEKAVDEMIDIAIANGVNYFDTAFPYHNGYSETVIGASLKRYDRSKYYLATKYPGHQISDTHYPEEIFEKQLKKCQVDHFDFYLLHNVCESSIDVYKDKKWDILNYFLKQKQAGRITHLGFSAHGKTDNFKEFLDYAGEYMEFCQIQLNYLDYSLQKANEKVEILNSLGIPIWVMEPVRGGKLATLNDEYMSYLSTFNKNATAVKWAFRYIQSIPGVSVVLSGMSNKMQMEDNIKIFNELKPLNEKEITALYTVADRIKGAVPCTACRYCVDTCPAGLDIPALISLYNEAKKESGFTVGMYMDSLSPEKLPNACIGCGKCTKTCPQKINVPDIMKDFSKILPTLPDWKKICEQRAAAAKAMENSK